MARNKKQISADDRILRVGLVHQSRIIEEKLVKFGADVTVGLNPKNTLILPISKPPESYTLFAFKDGKYSLRFTKGMTGKTSVNGKILTFDEIREQGLARNEGNHFLLPVGMNDAGKVTFGEVRLLFQMVTPPPPPKKMPLPSAARGGPLKAFEGPFMWALVFSMIVNIAGVGGARYWWHASGQYEADQAEKSIVYRVLKSEVVLKEKTPELDEAALDGEGEGDADDKGGGEVQIEEDLKPAKKFTKAASGPVDKAAEYRRQVAKVREGTILKYLGGAGGVRGMIGAEAADNDMEGAFASSGSGGGTIIADDAFGYRGGAAGRGGAGGGGGGNTYQKLSAADVKGTNKAIATKKIEATERVAEAAVKIRIGGRLGESAGPGKLNPASIESVFRRRRGAITTCYEKALKVNPSVEGKVSITFTIGSAGTVTQASVTENETGDSGIGQCIISKVKRWPFPPPDGGIVMVTRHFMLLKGG